MKAIDKIIFNELASRRAVVLPELGTLGVVRRPARITGAEVSPPVNQVIFSRDEAQDAVSVIMLMETMGVTHDNAQAAYAEWLAEVRACGEISLNGVGTVKEGVFVPSPELAQMLNPMRQRPAGEIVTPTATAPAQTPHVENCRCNYICLANIMLAAAILMLLIAGCVYFLQKGDGEKERVTQQQPAEIGSLHKVVDEEPAAIVTPEKTDVTVSGQYLLIAGSFAYESNADELVGKLSRNHPDLNVEKIITPAWIMVSVFRGVNADDAIDANRRLADVLNNYEMWVYKSK